MFHLAKFLASTAKNFLLLDLGMTVAFPTIVIPALTSDKFRYPDESLKLTNVQASWFGNWIMYKENITISLCNDVCSHSKQEALPSYVSRLAAYYPAF